MLVNAAALRAITINLRTDFNRALEAAPGEWRDAVMVVPSTTRQNDYAWLSRFPAMRKWLGDKIHKSLAAGEYTLVNENWETTIDVRRDDIEDDNLGIYSPMAQMAGHSSAELPVIITDNLKNDAFVNKGMDGQPMYGAHTITTLDGEEVTYTNKGAKKLSSDNLTSALASYGAARNFIMTVKDEANQPLRLVPDLLEVPPALEAIGRVLLEAEKLGDNSPNPYRNTARLRVNPGLTSDTAWFLHVTSKPVKPFIYQIRKAPMFVFQTDPENEHVFNKGIFSFGAEARATGGYGFWQLSYGSDGSVALVEEAKSGTTRK